MNNIDFSVVIPVYNSEKTLEDLYSRLKLTFDNMGKSFEVIFVNDCSVDNSLEVLRRIHDRNEKVIVADLFKNYGQQNALMCGFNFCSGENIITLDDDLQNPPEEIPILFDKLKEGYDAVFGSYREKKDKPYKNLGSLFIRKINHKVFNITNGLKFSSYRIIKSEIIDQLKVQKTPFPYISGMIMSITNKVTNVYIEHEERKFGHSNYNLKKLIVLSSNLLINYSAIPLRYVGFFGLLVSVLSFVMGTFFIFKKILLGQVPEGWTTLVVLISFYNCITLIIFFIISEYISRILRELSNKVQYTTREVIR